MSDATWIWPIISTISVFKEGWRYQQITVPSTWEEENLDVSDDEEDRYMRDHEEGFAPLYSDRNYEDQIIEINAVNLVTRSALSTIPKRKGTGCPTLGITKGHSLKRVLQRS